MTRIATPENEADLLAMAKGGPASHLERVVREYRKSGRAGIEKAQRQREGRYLNAMYDDDGMLVVQGRLPAEVRGPGPGPSSTAPTTRCAPPRCTFITTAPSCSRATPACTTTAARPPAPDPTLSGSGA